MEQFETLKIEREGDVDWLTLNRPERLNAFNHLMVAELQRYFDAMKARPDRRIIVLRGAGRAFCAGADLKDFLDPVVSEGGIDYEVQRQIEIIEDEGLVERADDLGARALARLHDLMDRHRLVGDARGRGLLMGVELVKDRQSKVPARDFGVEVSRRCLELGASLNIGRRSMGNIFRIAPPLTVTRDQIDTAVSIFDQALTECAEQMAQVSSR